MRGLLIPSVPYRPVNRKTCSSTSGLLLPVFGYNTSAEVPGLYRGSAVVGDISEHTITYPLLLTFAPKRF